MCVPLLFFHVICRGSACVTESEVRKLLVPLIYGRRTPPPSSIQTFQRRMEGEGWPHIPRNNHVRALLLLQRSFRVLSVLLQLDGIVSSGDPHLRVVAGFEEFLPATFL